MISRLLIFLPIAASAADLPLPEKPEYNRDVRPILADACFRCHGFDKNTREADRRLDTRDGALADNDGVKAIVPGKPSESELVKRLLTNNADDAMPPPNETRQLKAREKEILQRWIAQGAEYQDHWAYIPPVKPPVPGEGHPIDAFINAHLRKAGFAPAPPADEGTLRRRLYFDLTGLPPQPPDLSAPAAAVEKLLGSPQHSERLAVWWLDQVRYADTIGYHSDNPMPAWPWRDWVLRAFQENMRFDQFTVEQVAGDLLPNRSRDQLVASAYNRLILSTEEGGAQPGQYEAKHLVDRVKSIGTT